VANTPHELAEEFPEFTDRIRELNAANGHFARLSDEYHDVNRQIHRIETRIEPASEDVEEELKRRRVRLKDEIAQMLNGAEKTDGAATPGPNGAIGEPRLRGSGQA
jgi:uncharacterized protein YdcH (DUF465 family)